MNHTQCPFGYTHLLERLNRFPQVAPASKHLFGILRLMVSQKAAKNKARGRKNQADFLSHLLTKGEEWFSFVYHFVILLDDKLRLKMNSYLNITKALADGIVFQIMILSALSVGDIRQYDLLPLAFSKSLSEKL